MSEEAAVPETSASTQLPRGRRTRVRWMLVVLAGVGTAIAYVDRANLGVAMPFIREELNFGMGLQGIILSSFFWTYAFFQLPSGTAVDRFGPRVMFTVAAVWWSVFTAATAATRGIASLLGLRLALGIGEAPMMASNAKTVSQWFPRRERAFASSIFDTGSEFGSALSIPIVTALIAIVGWRLSFVVTGAVGLVWAIVWFWVYRTPRKHKWASATEVDYVESGGAYIQDEDLDESARRERAGAFSWRDLLRYRTVWGLFLGYVCRACVIYFFITWYPSYLADRGMGLVTMGLVGAIPGLVAILFDWGGGLFSDYLYRRGVRISLARKIPLVGGMLGASVIGLAGLASSTAMAMLLLTISFSSVAFATGALWSLPADVSPAAGNVATLGSLQNFGSQVGGIIVPMLVGFMAAASGGSFVPPLIAIGCITIIGAMIYAFVVKVEPLQLQQAGFRRKA